MLFVDEDREAKQKADDRISLQGSILDAVLGDAKSLNQRLSKPDSRKLDEYLASVRDVEGKLELDRHWQKIPKPKIDFKEPEKSRILSLLRTVPTIVDIFLERPAVIPEIAAEAIGLLANFGANDAALLDIVFGRFSPTGRLPFELPSSMEAVRNQKEDVPYDSENALFPFGFGLTYTGP